MIITIEQLLLIEPLVILNYVSRVGLVSGEYHKYFWIFDTVDARIKHWSKRIIFVFWRRPHVCVPTDAILANQNVDSEYPVVVRESTRIGRIPCEVAALAISRADREPTDPPVKALLADVIYIFTSCAVEKQ